MVEQSDALAKEASFKMPTPQELYEHRPGVAMRQAQQFMRHIYKHIRRYWTNSLQLPFAINIPKEFGNDVLDDVMQRCAESGWGADIANNGEVLILIPLEPAGEEEIESESDD